MVLDMLQVLVNRYKAKKHEEEIIDLTQDSDGEENWTRDDNDTGATNHQVKVENEESNHLHGPEPRNSQSKSYEPILKIHPENDDGEEFSGPMVPFRMGQQDLGDIFDGYGNSVAIFWAVQYESECTHGQERYFKVFSNRKKYYLRVDNLDLEAPKQDATLVLRGKTCRDATDVTFHAIESPSTSNRITPINFAVAVKWDGAAAERTEQWKHARVYKYVWQKDLQDPEGPRKLNPEALYEMNKYFQAFHELTALDKSLALKNDELLPGPSQSLVMSETGTKTSPGDANEKPSVQIVQAFRIGSEGPGGGMRSTASGSLKRRSEGSSHDLCKRSASCHGVSVQQLNFHGCTIGSHLGAESPKGSYPVTTVGMNGEYARKRQASPILSSTDTCSSSGSESNTDTCPSSVSESKSSSETEESSRESSREASPVVDSNSQPDTATGQESDSQELENDDPPQTKDSQDAQDPTRKPHGYFPRCSKRRTSPRRMRPLSG